MVEEKPYWMQVKEILEEEANRLALVLDGLRVEPTLKEPVLPHRVAISIHREVNRLRKLAAWVETSANVEDSLSPEYADATQARI